MIDTVSRRPPGVEFLSGTVSLVLFGAGGRGRRVLAGLRRAGIEPLAFTDNSPASQGQSVDGLIVLSPAEAARRYSSSAFVVTIWSDHIGHPLDEIQVQLEQLGVTQVASFTALYERYPDCFFPDFFLDRKEVVQNATPLILAAYELWEDASSREAYVAQLMLRLSLDFRVVDRVKPIAHPAYFPPDLFTLSEIETFVDCGAFDGDTYRDFTRLVAGSYHRYIAIEPDADSFAKLAAQVGAEAMGPHPHVRLLQIGVTDRPCVLRFFANGSSESRLSDDSDQSITCLPLDEILRDEHPSYLKMDIEGAELGALRGANDTLVRHRPILAVSAYHRARDLWDVPMLIASLVQNYAFFLRPEKRAGWDLICYAVPRERLLPATSSRP